MASCLFGSKPLPEPMMTQIIDALMAHQGENVLTPLDDKMWTPNPPSPTNECTAMAKSIMQHAEHGIADLAD